MISIVFASQQPPRYWTVCTDLRTHGSFVQHSRNAKDVIFTDVGHGAFDDTPAALQTSVPLESIPLCFTLCPMKHFKLLDSRHQHQLEKTEQIHQFDRYFTLSSNKTRSLTYRVDERVWILDVAVCGVQWQREADGVVQALLKAHRSHQQHMSGRQQTESGLNSLALVHTAAVKSTWIQVTERWTARLHSGWSCCSDQSGLGD